MHLKSNEKKMIENVARSEYHDGGPITGPTWSDCLFDGVHSFNRASVGGVVTSLLKKGLVGVDSHRLSEDSTVWLTESGAVAWADIKGELESCLDIGAEAAAPST